MCTSCSSPSHAVQQRASQRERVTHHAECLMSHGMQGCSVRAAPWICLHCLQTKALWLHVQAAAANKKRITSAGTSLFWVQHLSCKCLGRRASSSAKKIRTAKNFYEDESAFQPACITHDICAKVSHQNPVLTVAAIP